MKCVVFGATGYLGMRLIPQLLSAGHTVRVFARTPAKFDDVPWRSQVEVCPGDVDDAESVRTALDGREVLYYLVHSLLRPDFVEFDQRSARTVATAAKAAGLSRIVYVGGIIPEGQRLSEHLASREEVGQLLQESGVPTVELRAAAIIGAGSASFEMLRYLTERLPIMVTPRWLRTRIQPIAVRDVLYYLVEAATLDAQVNRPFDIGGPDRFTYTEMIRKYAAVARLPRRLALPVPVLTPRLSARWVEFVTPIPRQLATSLMESLENDVVCADRDIAEYIPDPSGGLTHYEDAVELALTHVRETGLRTRFSRADGENAPSQPLRTDPDWAGGPLHEDDRQRVTAADSATLWRAIEVAAADDTWSSLPWGWPLRGWVKVRSRAAHRPAEGGLHDGQSLHWWRVEHLDAPKMLRLRADIPLPGRLWLELSVLPCDGGSIYRQRALFQPYGLGGQIFWSALAPLRKLAFDGIARDITTAARLHGKKPTQSGGDHLERQGVSQSRPSDAERPRQDRRRRGRSQDHR